MGRRKLPPDETLLRWKQEGLSFQEIADRASLVTGEKVTRAAVSLRMKAMGLGKTQARYLETIPWRVRPEHLNHHIPTMLRYEARVMRGEELPPDAAKRHASWKRRLEEANAVVDYMPQHPDGWVYRKRKPQDGDGVIRRPEVPAEVPDEVARKAEVVNAMFSSAS